MTQRAPDGFAVAALTSVDAGLVSTCDQVCALDDDERTDWAGDPAELSAIGTLVGVYAESPDHALAMAREFHAGAGRRLLAVGIVPRPARGLPAALLPDERRAGMLALPDVLVVYRTAAATNPRFRALVDFFHDVLETEDGEA